MCENAIYKFNCTCAMGCYGRATSCKELLQRDDGTDLSIVRWLWPNEQFRVWGLLWFHLWMGFVWTLIESFSFRYNDEFKDKAFYEDYPLNQEAFKSFTWSKFRLSLYYRHGSFHPQGFLACAYWFEYPRMYLYQLIRRCSKVPGRRR